MLGCNRKTTESSAKETEQISAVETLTRTGAGLLHRAGRPSLTTPQLQVQPGVWVKSGYLIQCPELSYCSSGLQSCNTPRSLTQVGLVLFIFLTLQVYVSYKIWEIFSCYSFRYFFSPIFSLLCLQDSSGVGDKYKTLLNPQFVEALVILQVSVGSM